MARYGLMRLVEPSDRELARLQMVASAAAYGHQVDLMPASARVYSFPDANTAAGELARTFTSGDADGMEAMVLSIALQFGTKSLLNLLPQPASRQWLLSGGTACNYFDLECLLD
jgi:hypothetical protein